MLKSSRSAILLFCISLAVCSSHGSIVTDVDPATAGFQSTLHVLPGATVPVALWFDPSSGPVGFNAVGLDLNWITAGGATASPMTPLMAGAIVTGAGFGSGGGDMITGDTFILPGDPLTPAGLSPDPGIPGALSLGGAGHLDSLGTGYGLGPGPLGFAFELMWATFTVTGPPGSSVTFTPSGIFMPPAGPFPGSGPFVAGGDALQAALFTGPTVPQTFVGGTITVIPEPASILLLVIGLAGTCLCRRKPKAQGIQKTCSCERERADS